MPDLTLTLDDVELLESLARNASARAANVVLSTSIDNDPARIAMNRYGALADKLAERIRQGLHPPR